MDVNNITDQQPAVNDTDVFEPTPVTQPQDTPPTTSEPTGEPPSQAEGGQHSSSPSSSTTSSPDQPTNTSATSNANAPVYVDAKQLAAEMQAQKAANAPAPQIPQEEIDKILRNYTIADNEVEAFLNPDTPIATKAKMLKLFIQRGVENAVARSTVIATDAMQKFYQNEFVPVQKTVSYNSAQSSRKQFYQEYPGLEQYQDAVALVAESAAHNPQVAKMTDREVSKFVADQTTAMLRKTLPNFDPKVKAAGNPSAAPAASVVPKATQSSFVSGTRVTTNPSNGHLPSSGSSDADIFGDEGLQ